MSTLKVNAIESQATDSAPTIAGVQYPTAGSFSHRNMVINGAMNVAQRGTSHTITSNIYTLDRYQAIGSGSFSWDSATVSQDSDAPDGFNNSLRVDVNTAQSVSGGNNALIRYQIESQDLQRLAFGTSEAKSFTVSFWVKSDKTGTYCLQVCQDDASKYQIKEYTVSNSWERKEITFEANTADSIDDDNGRGFDLRWHLATGSDDHHDATTSWASSNTYRATSNQVNLFDNASNNFRITGIQLEVGDKATPFEHRSYGEELDRCKRYYQRAEFTGDGIISTGTSWTAASAIAPMWFEKEMRAAPTVTLPAAGSNNTQISFLTEAAQHPSTIGSHTASKITKYSFSVLGSGYSGLTNDGSSWLYPNGGGNAVFEYDAEI